MSAGRQFGIMPAGVAAMDLLDLEAGVARPFLDYRPARDAEDAEPSALSLGLEKLIDDTHAGFNGRSAFLVAKPATRLVGLDIQSDQPAPFTPIALNEKPVGHTLRSFYSPSLRRAIALARLDATAIKPDTVVSLTLPPGLAVPELRKAEARVVALPFLPPPASIAP
jgi:aminomethyltransferase